MPKLQTMAGRSCLYSQPHPKSHPVPLSGDQAGHPPPPQVHLPVWLRNALHPLEAPSIAHNSKVCQVVPHHLLHSQVRGAHGVVQIRRHELACYVRRQPPKPRCVGRPTTRPQRRHLALHSPQQVGLKLRKSKLRSLPACAGTNSATSLLPRRWRPGPS